MRDGNRDGISAADMGATSWSRWRHRSGGGAGLDGSNREGPHLGGGARLGELSSVPGTIPPIAYAGVFTCLGSTAAPSFSLDASLPPAGTPWPSSFGQGNGGEEGLSGSAYARSVRTIPRVPEEGKSAVRGFLPGI